MSKNKDRLVHKKSEDMQTNMNRQNQISIYLEYKIFPD